MMVPWSLYPVVPSPLGSYHTGAEPDWSYVRDIETVEFQLMDPERSRTTWIMEYEGACLHTFEIYEQPGGQVMETLANGG